MKYMYVHIVYGSYFRPLLRLTVLTSLASSPPFTRRVESKLDTLELVEQLWDVLW